MAIVSLPTTLDEAKSNAALKSYVKFVGADNANAFGETAWAAGMLFHQAIDTIVARDGVNGITRAKFLDELAKIGDFDAGGMLAPTNIGARVPSACRESLSWSNRWVANHWCTCASAAS